MTQRGGLLKGGCVLAGMLWLGLGAGPAQAAYTVEITAADTVTFTGDSAPFDQLFVSKSGGDLQYSLNGSPASTDLDSEAGTQTLADAASAHVIVSGGGGIDLIQLGTAGTSFASSFDLDGGDGTDFIFLTPGTGGDDNVTLNNNTVSGLPSGLVTLAAPASQVNSDQLNFTLGEGNDTVNVIGATTDQTIVSAQNGDDTLNSANGASVGGGSRFVGGIGTDTLDFSAWTAPVTIDLFKTALFKATLDGASQVPASTSVATGAGQLEFTDLTTNTFGYELSADGITAAQITDSHIHTGAAGTNGPVVFPIGPALPNPPSPGWTDPGAGSTPSTFADDQTDPDISEPALRGGNTYFNIHTSNNFCSGPCTGGEIRGQLTLDPDRAYGGTATGWTSVNTIEKVKGGSGNDTIKGSVPAENIDCGPGVDSESSGPEDTVTGCETLLGASVAVTGTDPASPANNLTPKVKGTVAPSHLNVRIFTNASCTGAPVASGTAAGFAGAGIPVTVADGSLTTFYAAAADASAQSACSATSASYQETATVTPPPPPGGTPVGSVAAIKPKASGRGSKITIDTRSTAKCPTGASAPCTTTARATARVPLSALGKKRAGKRATTLARLTAKVAKGKSLRVKLKLSRKMSAVWRKAGRLAITVRITLTVPGGKPVSRTRTVSLRPPKRR